MRVKADERILLAIWFMYMFIYIVYIYIRAGHIALFLR